MIYSVYNYDTKLYDYFEGPGPSGTHAGAPPVSLGRSSLGATVEQAAWKVPGSAKKVGSGPMPRGRVAAVGGIALGGFELDGKTAAVVALCGVAYLVGKKVLR